jgi:hypothetical protein
MPNNMPNVTTVRLPDDLSAAMEKLEERDGVPGAEQIRRALADWLTKKGTYTKKKSNARSPRVSKGAKR